MEVRTIVSIYPAECREVRPTFQPITTFILPAAKKGEISMLRIEPQTDPQFGGSDIPPFLKQIPASQIAEDLVRCWRENRLSTGMPANAAPGIWIADEPEPTEEQIRRSKQFAAFKAGQDAYFTWQVFEADRLFRKDGGRQNINDRHYLAADALGVTGRPWQDTWSSDSLKDCLYCGKKIPVAAIKCQFCLEVVEPERYAKERAKVDEAKEKAAAKYIPPRAHSENIQESIRGR